MILRDNAALRYQSKVSARPPQAPFLVSDLSSDSKSNIHTMTSQRQWIVCQIGAREHYGIPAELHRRGQLSALCTDVWAGPVASWRIAIMLGGAKGHKFCERFEPTLAKARVLSESPASLILHEMMQRLASVASPWTRIMAANRRFGTVMARRLRKTGLLAAMDGSKPIVFAYSYGALGILEAAKAAGCTTVLAQIDPGPEEETIVLDKARSLGLPLESVCPAPPEYWALWRKEIVLADIILANSTWSSVLLKRGGVPEAKLRIAPLAYETTQACDSRAESSPKRCYPSYFSVKHPLDLLFLGQANTRKGIVELVQAVRCLEGKPLRLTIVGNLSTEMRRLVESSSNIDWLGQRPRGEAITHFQRAHAFILPTHSDGFAMTQLEALAEGTPLIVSRHCGDVVEEGVQGRILEAVAPDAIKAMLLWAIANPASLAKMSEQGPERLAAFKPDRVVDLIETHIESVH